MDCPASLNANFPMPAGDSVELNVVVDAPDGVTLDGVSIRWIVARQSFGEALDILIDKSTGGHGIEITDTEERRFRIDITSSDTEGLSGRFYHEAEIVSSGKRYTVLAGLIDFLPTVINAEA